MGLPTRTHDNAFLGYLEGIADRQDRGALAALRRGLGRPPGSAEAMHPHVARFLPDGWSWSHQCHYIVAALFGMHPRSVSSGNLGDTFRAMAAREGQALGQPPESLERRFVTLLKCHRDDLFDHLRHAISLARSKDMPVNWEHLLVDLRSWDSEDHWVQRNWARAFWRSAPSSQQEQTDTHLSGE